MNASRNFIMNQRLSPNATYLRTVDNNYTWRLAWKYLSAHSLSDPKALSVSVCAVFWMGIFIHAFSLCRFQNFKKFYIFWFAYKSKKYLVICVFRRQLHWTAVSALFDSCLGTLLAIFIYVMEILNLILFKKKCIILKAPFAR